MYLGNYLEDIGNTGCFIYISWGNLKFWKFGKDEEERFEEVEKNDSADLKERAIKSREKEMLMDC